MGRRTSKKPVSSFLLITRFLLIVSHVGLVFGYETTYEFGEDCSSYTKDLDEDDKRYVEYNGKPVDFFCDYFKFRGRGYEILDKYSVCVTPLYFNDMDCAVEINIKTSLFGVTKHKITCSENKRVQYCGPQDDTLYVEFKKRPDRDTNGAEFKLKITAKKEYEYNESHTPVIGAIIGGVVGGLILITVSSALICIVCVCRRKHSQGRVLNPTQGYPATPNPYVVYGAQTQQNMTTTPSIITSQGVYPMTSHSSLQGAACPQTENQLASAPPSYDTVTESSTSHVYDAIQESSKTAY